jgi:hypothetical protein
MLLSAKRTKVAGIVPMATQTTALSSLQGGRVDTAWTGKPRQHHAGDCPVQVPANFLFADPRRIAGLVVYARAIRQNIGWQGEQRSPAVDE